MKDTFTSEEQQSTNQNKKNKKNSVRRTKKAQKMIQICGRRKNSEVKVSHAEKDMKNLPTIHYIVKGSHIQKIMKEKKNREQRDSVQKTMSEGKKEKCLSDMSREKSRCSSSMVLLYNN